MGTATELGSGLSFGVNPSLRRSWAAFLKNSTISGQFPEIASRLVDVAPDGTETLVDRGLYRPDGSGKPEVFQLHPGGWHFAAGHRPKLVLLGRDVPYARASSGQFQITVSNLIMELPTHETSGNGILTNLALPLPAGFQPATGVTTTPVVFAPQLTLVSQSHARWREGSRLAAIATKKRRKKAPVGTTFRFTLNEPARVLIAFSQRVGGRRVSKKCVAPTRRNKHRPPCRRTVMRGVLVLGGHAGADRVSFQGRISRTKRLKPGRYTAVITAINRAGQRSAPRTLTFTILKG